MNRQLPNPFKNLAGMRAHRLYSCAKEPAAAAKVLLQMAVAVVAVLLVFSAITIDITQARSTIYVEKQVFVIIAAALAVAAALELAHTLFTPSADEIIDPLMLGISAALLFLLNSSAKLTWNTGIAVVLFSATLALLFAIRKRFIDDSDDVRERQVSRRAEWTPQVKEKMISEESTALDLLEMAELAWHDRHGDDRMPDDVIADILTCAQNQLHKMVSAAKLAINDCHKLHRNAADVRKASDDSATCAE